MTSGISDIREFFKNQTVFITGGSGFVGKVLIEKLLRECHDLKHIYVLMRPKKNKTPEERFDELFGFACFDRLKSENKNALKKVRLVNGDCTKPRMGLSEQSLDVLRKETTCVIHAAANVKFDQSLREAAHNVSTTKDLLALAKQMSDLRALVYVSTAYSNCVKNDIKEEFYEPPIKAETLLTLVDAFEDEILESIKPTLLGQWPNIYVYSKCIAEDLIKDVSDNLPVAIVRPAVVCCSINEPVPGWIDNIYGVIGIVVGAALGLLRSLYVKSDAIAYTVPVDFVANCILASAWRREKSGVTQIYNYVGSEKTWLTWKTFMEKVEPVCWTIPSKKVVWYYSFKLRENKLWHDICIFFSHTVVSYVVDFVLFCCGKPTLAVQNYRRLNKMLALLSYFGIRYWTFQSDNVENLWKEMNEEDRNHFNFDMSTIDMDSWIRDSIYGARLHLLKETLDTIPQGERKLKILRVAHYTLLVVFYFIMYKLVIFIIGLFF